MTYASAKFETATRKGFEGDAFTRQMTESHTHIRPHSPTELLWYHFFLKKKKTGTATCRHSNGHLLCSLRCRFFMPISFCRFLTGGQHVKVSPSVVGRSNLNLCRCIGHMMMGPLGNISHDLESKVKLCVFL